MRPSNFRLMAIAVLCLVPAVALAQQDVRRPTTTLPPRMVAAIDAAIADEMQKQELVGVALGVIHNGKVAYLKGYGLADAQKQTPVTPQTVFNWASNSKVVLAVAAMQLVQQGKLDLDADIRTYLPEFPDKGHTITVRHLLCHQSGIPHYSNGRIVRLTNRRFPPEAELDPVIALNRFAGSPLIFKPGERMEYSSFAYVALSAVVQKAGQQSLLEQIQTRIVRPLDMRSFQLDTPYMGQANWATGYNKNDQGLVAPVSDYAHFWKHGAGGYKSNIADFAAWAEALVNHKLMNHRTEQLMWTRQRTANGQETRNGLGVFVVGSGRDLEVYHGGSQDEARSYMRIFPARRQAVVVLTNCGYADTNKISARVAEILTNRAPSRTRQAN
jgi:serine beta-lactamase-like protein LACTB